MVEETEQKLSKQERQKRHRLRQSYRTYMLIGGALLVVGLIIFGKTLVTATTDAPAWSKLNANMRRANQPHSRSGAISTPTRTTRWRSASPTTTPA